MAGVDKIKDKILKDCEEKVKKVIEDANKQAESIIEKAKNEAEQKVSLIKKKADNDANEKRRIANSMVELEIRKDILSSKQDVIEKVFKTVLDRLCTLDNNEYDKIIYNMVISAVETGEEEIVLSEEGSKKVSKDLVERVNSCLKNQGKVANVRLSQEKCDIAGGFVLKSEGIEINNSFEALLRLNRDEIEPKVAELLF